MTLSLVPRALALVLRCCTAAAMTLPRSLRRSDLLRVAAAGAVPWPALPATAKAPAAVGNTNEVVEVVDGIRHKRLGGSGIIVSEVGLGTQRWGSTDFNAPSFLQCEKFLDRAILESGVNLIDTAEQYPIPSDGSSAHEGYTEQIIGSWLKQDKTRRQKARHHRCR